MLASCGQAVEQQVEAARVVDVLLAVSAGQQVALRHQFKRVEDPAVGELRRVVLEHLLHW